jgi:Skp family chaperone for outer membrane proteins
MVCALFTLALATTTSTAQEKITPAPAAGPVPVKLAIIDVETIRSQTAVVKDVRRQIEKFRTTIQAEIKDKEDALREATQELERQRTILSPDAYTEERRKFGVRIEEVQRLLQKRKKELESVRGEAMRSIQAALTEIVTALANERGLTLILRKSQTILAAKALDITAVVLERLDKRLPSLKVRKPGN